MKRILSILSVLVLAASLGSVVDQGVVTAATQVPNPTVWYVAENGSGVRDGSDWNNAFPTIQQAVDLADAGDTIMVAAGKYEDFLVKGKSGISIVGAKGATVTNTNLYTALPVIGSAWVMAAVYDSQNIKIKGINFDGAGVRGKDVCVGIAYVDSTGTISGLTIENVVATSLGAGVAIIRYAGNCAVVMTDATVANNGRTGIYVCGGSALEVHFSNILRNAECGLLNDAGGMVDATYNWWGHASGPLHQTNLLGKGNAIFGDVDFKPWLAAAPAIVRTVTATDCAYCPVDARAEADTEVVVKGTATVTIAKLVVSGMTTSVISKYADSLYLPTSHDSVDNVAPNLVDFAVSPEFEPLNIFRDVRCTDTTPETEIEIRLYYTSAAVSGFDETTLWLFWHNGYDWVKCSHGGVNTTDMTIDGTRYSGYMYARVTSTTSPSLQELGGTPWGGYGHPTETPRPCGCLIATVAYGADTAQQIGVLRQFRDAVLLPNTFGARLVSLYYQASPPIAKLISQHAVLKTMVRLGLVDPIVTMLSWTYYLWSAEGP